MTIRYEVADAVATITLARPEKRNALTMEMREQLVELLALARDPAVRAVLLVAEGADFCAGADVTTMGKLTSADSRQRMQQLHSIVLGLHLLDKPVVAAVRGSCVGVGWSMALACDWVLASPTARFAQIFRRIGLAPDGGAVFFLSRAIGVPRARELVLSGRFLPAQEARDLGLIQAIEEDEALDDAALQLAKELASGPTTALALSKRMFDAVSSPGLEAFLKTELLVQPILSQTSDHREGVAAFQEKRPPVFKGD